MILRCAISRLCLRRGLSFVLLLFIPVFAGMAAETSTAQAVVSGAKPATPPVSTRGAPVQFEVSAVKISKPGADGSDSDFRDGRFTASNCSLESLIEYEGYGIPRSRILGGPKWLRSEHFDVQAKMDEPSLKYLHALPREERRKQTRAMFQQLLADRFKLAVHWETRQMPIYAMVVAKKGPGFQATKEPDGHFPRDRNYTIVNVVATKALISSV